MRPFAVYPASFDGSTLGWWRFGERGGRLDGVVGPTLTNVGADPRDDGFRFVRENGDNMSVTFAGQPARAAMTLECWVRGVVVAAGGTRSILGVGLNEPNQLCLYLARHATDSALSYLSAALYIGGSVVGYARWQSAAAETLFLGPTSWHIAAVLNATASLTLFVNGVQRAQDTTGIVSLPAGDWILKVGRWISGWNGYDLSAVLDEVRLSAAARYAATFRIARFGEGRRAAARGPGLECLAGAIP